MRELRLNPTQRRALEGLLAKRTAHAGHVPCARIVLLSAHGISGHEIPERVGVSERRVSRNCARCLAGGRPGLEVPKAGREGTMLSVDTTERGIIQKTLSPPPAGRTAGPRAFTSLRDSFPLLLFAIWALSDFTRQGPVSTGGYITGSRLAAAPAA